jgi:predicted 2-oxoglutarate/Fe(II)-dependent dioxygenase YbiX
MQFSPGDPFPHLQGQTPSVFLRFDYMPGRYIVLAYLPASAPAGEIRQVMAELARHEAVFDDAHCCFFGVLRHPQLIATAANSPGIRWFLDPDGDLFRESGMASDGGEDESGWIVLDPALRVLKTAPLAEAAEVLRWVAALSSVDDHAGTPIHAPVLIVPRILEPKLCAELIAMHRGGRAVAGPLINHDDNGQVSAGYVDSNYRSSQELTLTDPDVKRRVEDRIRRRLAPEILRSLRYTVSEIESYSVNAYDAADSGRFRVHRDNLPPLQRRQFTFAINLNAEDYEGGNLRFPEHGTRTYRAPSGGAIVFASSLLHEVTVVTKGRRYVLIAFLADRPQATRHDRERNREPALELQS